MTNIGESAFAGCTGLTEIVIPHNVTSIGKGAFSGCTSLKTITIPFVGAMLEPGTTYFPFGYIFGTSSFEGGIATTQKYESNGIYVSPTYYIPGSLKSVTVTGGDIYDGAFDNCTSLTNVTIGHDVSTIAAGAFMGCNSLESMTIPFTGYTRNSATRPWQYPFGYIFGTSSYEGGVATTQQYYGSSTSSISSDIYYIPASLKTVAVTDRVGAAGDDLLYGAFYNCSGLTSVTIGENISSIEGCAFYGCTGLTSVEISSRLIHIGDSAFMNCSGLTYVTIPDSVITIDDYAFQGCTGLTEIVFGNGLTTIGGYVFKDCTGLTSVSIPDSVTSVGISAFDGCTRLTSATIGTGLTSIAVNMFDGCTSLTGVIIPDNVTDIGHGAYAGCTSLTQIIIPDSVTSMGIDVFGYCTGLTSVTIGSGLTRIEDSTFRYCTNLTNITIPDGIIYIGSSAFSDTGLTQITIPAGVTSIENSTFNGCTNLKQVTIPTSVTNIADWAFSNCTGLLDVYYGGTQDQWEAITIESTTNAPLLNANIHYNAGAVHEAHYGQKQLALDSDLYMDFYVAVSEAVATDENAKMQISLGGKLIDEIALKDAKAATGMDAEDGYTWYVFTAEVPVKDMTKEISLQLVDSTGNVGGAYTYTVKEYADYLLANSTDEKVLNVCQALLDYGAAAEKHFAVRAGGTVADSELANGGDFGTRLDGATVADIYKPAKDGNITGVTCYGTSLILEADTAIRLYFAADSAAWEGTTVVVDVIGATYEVQRINAGYVCVEITGIHAADLDTKYTVTLVRGEERITICYSGLSYAWAILNGSTNETLCQMVKGLYKYWEAAETYNYVPIPEPSENEFEILPV